MRFRFSIRSSLSFTVLATAIAGAWACSSGDDSAAPGDDSDAGSLANDAAPDAHCTGDCSPVDSGNTHDSGPGAAYTGQIFVLDESATDGGLIGKFGAAFSVSGAGAGCTQATSGTCTITSCSSSSDPDASAPNAGVITITGATLAAPIVLTPSASGHYAASALTNAAFTTGDTFSISAAGGAVTAFSGTSAPAVGSANLSSPSVVGDGGIFGGVYGSIDRSQDLNLVWSGGTAGGKVDLTLVKGKTTAECVFDAAPGTATVSKGVLGQLAAGNDGFLVFYAEAAAKISSSNASVEVDVVGPITHGVVPLQ